MILKIFYLKAGLDFIRHLYVKLEHYAVDYIKFKYLIMKFSLIAGSAQI